jgi:hypothetical protein
MTDPAYLPNLEPCDCNCDCVGVRTDDEPDRMCLACRHGFHTEDE